MVISKILDEMRKKPAPCYVLSGENKFLKEEFLKDVKSLLPSASVDFNYDVFGAGGGSVRDVISTALSYPLGCDFRIIIVKDCGRLSEEEQQAVLSYIEEPSGHAVLIFDFDKPPASKVFYKNLLSAGREIKFKAKTREETASWLKDRAARLGKKLSAEALRLLQSEGGEDLGLLANEIEKLSLRVGDKEEIEGGDTGFTAGRPAKSTGFELGKAISGGDCALALRILNDLDRSADAASEMLIGALAWHFRAVWKVDSAVRAGTPPAKLSAVCGVPPFRLHEFRRYGRKYSNETLSEIFKELLRTDINLKRRQFSSLDMELLVVKICGITSLRAS